MNLAVIANRAMRKLKMFRLLLGAARVLPPARLVQLIRSTLTKNIYPIDIPEVRVKPDLDFLVLELPVRFVPMLPNGIGHVYNILKSIDMNFQVIDFNIVMYHRFHSKRLHEGQDPVVTTEGYEMKPDPWISQYADEWTKDEALSYFWPQFEELLDDVVRNAPKAVGISVHASNRVVVQRFIAALRERLPDTLIVVGGYDCVRRDAGQYLVKDFDYMVIGEAEMTLEALAMAISKGERPKDLPGIVSRFDSSDRQWDEPLKENLDEIDFPRYEWTDMSLYRTYDDNRLAPISASRGCVWSRCRFCAECFTFRRKSPSKVVDEMEFLASKGFIKLHFNESDINGDPENLYNICTEVINRRVGVLLGGQIRIDRRNTREYFDHLKKAGILRLIFGVDGWTNRLLRLQRKGYTMKMVFQNLRDCHAAGIYEAVNFVIGVPGETEEDVDEIIENFLKCKKYIDIIEAANTLILVGGSEYYKNPDAYKIRFREDREEIYQKHPYMVPTELWYSEEPYIDQDIRVERLSRVCRKLWDNGLNITPNAMKIVKQISGEK